MKNQKKQQETVTPKIRNTIVGLGIGTLVVGSAVTFSLWFNERSQIYTGSVNIPRVERVHAYQVHDACPQFSCLRYAGNNVDVYLSNGERASIRDYNGDFHLDGSDSTNGLPVDVNANQILQETRRNAGKINSYLSLF